MNVICPTCAGKRVIETTVPNLKRYGGVDYTDPHTPTKTRVDVCPTCNYAGVVNDASLDAIRDRTLAAALVESDRAARA